MNLKILKEIEKIDNVEEQIALTREYYANYWWDAIYDGLFQIQTKSGEVIPLHPNSVQKKIIERVKKLWIENKKPIRLLIPKARQHGVSTIIEAITIAILGYVGQKKALIIADEGKKATNIFNMAKLMATTIEDIIRPVLKESNARTLAFEDINSRIDIDSAENRDAGRSGNWQIAHLSELDYYPDAPTLMTGLSSCIAKLPRTMIFMESTGNGVGSYFHQMIQKAVRGENEYEVFFFAWYENPEYQIEPKEHIELMEEGKYGNEVYYQEKYDLSLAQLNWRRHMIRNEFNYNLRKFAQEYPADISESFIASGQPVFDRLKLEGIQKDYTTESLLSAVINGDKMVKANGGYVKIWQKPELGYTNRYVIFADTGGLWYENDKNCADYSTAVVLDRITRKVVATVHGHFASLHYARMLVHLAKYYDNAKLAIEINRYASETDEQGLSVIDRIRKKVKYHNFYTREVYDDELKETTTKIGFHTNRETKQLLVNRLINYVNNYKEEDVKVNDSKIIDEMITYVITQTKTGKTTWNAQEGYKDDRVIAFGGALVVSDEMPAPSVKIQEYYDDEIIEGVL